jgi:hypothetical protein
VPRRVWSRAPPWRVPIEDSRRTSAPGRGPPELG